MRRRLSRLLGIVVIMLVCSGFAPLTMNSVAVTPIHDQTNPNGCGGVTCASSVSVTPIHEQTNPSGCGRVT